MRSWSSHILPITVMIFSVNYVISAIFLREKKIQKVAPSEQVVMSSDLFTGIDVSAIFHFFLIVQHSINILMITCRALMSLCRTCVGSNLYIQPNIYKRSYLFKKIYILTRIIPAITKSNTLKCQFTVIL